MHAHKKESVPALHARRHAILCLSRHFSLATPCVQWKVNGAVVKSESPIPNSHFPMRFAAAIYTAQDPSLTGIEWVPVPPSPPPAPSPPPSLPVSFSDGAASLDSTISSASSGTLSKNRGGNAWGDYAFSDYELTKDGCVVPPAAHTVSPHLRTRSAGCVLTQAWHSDHTWSSPPLDVPSSLAAV